VAAAPAALGGALAVDGEGAVAAADDDPEVAPHSWTPPWRAQAPVREVPENVVPSLQVAVSCAGAPPAANAIELRKRDAAAARVMPAKLQAIVPTFGLSRGEFSCWPVD